MNKKRGEMLMVIGTILIGAVFGLALDAGLPQSVLPVARPTLFILGTIFGLALLWKGWLIRG